MSLAITSSSKIATLLMYCSLVLSDLVSFNGILSRKLS